MNLVEVHQKHRKYWQGKNVIEVVRWKKKGIVVAVSAEKKKSFSTRPLTIIKVQHEATARVVQPLNAL